MKLLFVDEILESFETFNFNAVSNNKGRFKDIQGYGKVFDSEGALLRGEGHIRFYHYLVHKIE